MCCGKTVDPDELPTSIAEDSPALCRWAIEDPRWQERLKSMGGEAGRYFTRNCGDIRADRDEAKTDGRSVEDSPDYDYPNPLDSED